MQCLWWLVLVFWVVGGCKDSRGARDANALESVPAEAQRGPVERTFDGERVGAYEAGTFRVYDRDGAVVAELEAPPSGLRHKLLGDGSRVLTPIAEARGEHVDAYALQIRNLAGRELARFATPGLRFTSLSQAHVLAVLPDSLASYDFAGALRWRAPVAAYSAAAARLADAVLVVDAADTRNVIHLAEGEVVKRAELREPVWNVALAPHGAHTAVTTAKRLYTFERGALRKAIALPVLAAASLDVSDAGVIVVGGHDEAHRGVVLCYAPDGALLSRTTLARDDDSFSPRVRFDDDERYTASTAQGVTHGACAGSAP